MKTEEVRGKLIFDKEYYDVHKALSRLKNLLLNYKFSNNFSVKTHQMMRVENNLLKVRLQLRKLEKLLIKK